MATLAQLITVYVDHACKASHHHEVAKWTELAIYNTLMYPILTVDQSIVQVT